MVDSLMNIEPDAAPSAPATPAPGQRLAQFEQANASLSLDGLTVDAGDLDIQRRIANGLLTPDEAVATYFRLAGKAAP